MKLTQVLFRMKPRLPRGNIFKGKYRIVKPITGLAVATEKDNYEIEERNMFFLRHPYLTPEQSYGHAQLFEHKKKFFQKMRDVKGWKDNKLLGDRFGFLKINDKWE